MSNTSWFPKGSHLESIRNHCIEDRKIILDQVFSNKWAVELLDGLEWRERVFTPLVTIWVFINQVLDQDHSCRAAVTSLIALRSFLKVPINSTATGAYCRARMRLPLSLIKDLAQGSSRRLRAQIQSKWLWKGFEILLIDGSHVSMPDTQENRANYFAEGIGLGLVKARVLGIFSLACGSILEFRLGPWRGKGTGEVSMFRELVSRLAIGQLVVMDRLFCGYVDMGLLASQGVDFVIRAAHERQKMPRGQRLGKDDWLIELTCPWHRAESVGRKYLDRIAKKMTIRLTRISLKQKGFRAKEIYLLSSLKDHKKYPPEEIAQLYAWRWGVEVDIRSLKTSLGLDVLRCKTPEMVEKEVWMHVLVYNMIRVVMAEASLQKGLRPAQISFHECVQLIKNFRIISSLVGESIRERLYSDLVESIKSRVGNRPGRREPRLLKHNYQQKYSLLRIPRDQARYGFWKKGWAYNKHQRENYAAQTSCQLNSDCI
jgi:hypothetical protein